jgi:hypothetical protein
MITAGKKFRARGRANGADIKAIELRPIAGERIDIGGRKIFIPAQAQVAPALIIGENDHDVGRLRLSQSAKETAK